MSHNELGRGWNEPKKPSKSDREMEREIREAERFFTHLGEQPNEKEERDSLKLEP